ncbi:unnamed protein product [Paramecium sonneborni]|uniref:Uncharacterized protein n=1 Tax=Paramecium sonneborni TaxID=65129 RepID=A0A8S1RJY0_9CILI|nr:unnamed protein product [Paramecium sonneborni]
MINAQAIILDCLSIIFVSNIQTINIQSRKYANQPQVFIIVQIMIVHVFQSSALFIEQIFPNEERYSIKFSDLFNSSEFDQTNTGLLHGIFTKNSGTYRFVDLSQFQQGICLIGIRMMISFYNDIPIGGGIKFEINNTYYGSILNTNEEPNYIKQINLHALLYGLVAKYLQYSYLLIFQNILLYLQHLEITKLQLQDELQENLRYLQDIVNPIVNFVRYLTYVKYVTMDYIYQVKNCVPCNGYYETINSNFCDSYDQETQCINEVSQIPNFQQKMSILVRQMIHYIYQQIFIQTISLKVCFSFIKICKLFKRIKYNQWISFIIIKLQTLNLQSVSVIHFGQASIFLEDNLFGVKKNLKQLINLKIHIITLGFYILYGKNFPSDGQFIYIFESKQSIIKSRTNDDGTMKFIHSNSSNTLTLYWECSGSNRNPQDSYCGVYGYNVIVHYCQPNCLQCLNYNACSLWDIDVSLKYKIIIQSNQNFLQRNHVKLENIKNRNVYLVLQLVLLVHLHTKLLKLYINIQSDQIKIQLFNELIQSKQLML